MSFWAAFLFCVLGAREQVKTRHNIVRRDCAKLDGWSYTITDGFYHLLYSYNKVLISRIIGDSSMLLSIFV